MQPIPGGRFTALGRHLVCSVVGHPLKTRSRRKFSPRFELNPPDPAVAGALPDSGRESVRGRAIDCKRARGVTERKTDQPAGAQKPGNFGNRQQAVEMAIAPGGIALQRQPIHVPNAQRPLRQVIERAMGPGESRPILRRLSGAGYGRRGHGRCQESG
jgi:hypothetical protein